MKALGKGSIASIMRAGLHVFGVLLWIALAAIILGAIGLGSIMALQAAGMADWNLDMDGHEPLFFAALLVGIFYVGGTILIVRRLRYLFDSFTSGEPFRRENANHLRVIWVTMLVMEVARYLLGAIFLAAIAFFGLPHDLNAEVREESFDLAPWLAILVLIVLAEVFREGARMKEEQELTI